MYRAYQSQTEVVNDIIDQGVEEKQGLVIDFLRVTPEQTILDDVEDCKRDKE